MNSKYNLTEIDKLEIHVLMDNISDPFTKSHDGLKWNEFQYQYEERKLEHMCGSDMCRACDGLSLLITVYRNDQKFTLLFDTGPDEGLAVDNAKRLGLDLTQVDGIVLSHGHFDHFGGTLSVLDAVGKPNLPVYVHPEVFLPRAFDRGTLIKVTSNLTAADIEKHNGQVIANRNPTLLFDGSVFISGEIERKTAYETGSPSECRYSDGKWVKSPEVIDERCLIFNLKNQGLCIITGCGHTGVINAIEYAKDRTHLKNIHLIMGGFHLAGNVFANRIDPTVSDLLKINPDYIVTGHCTGRKAQTELSKAFEDKHIPYGVGTLFRFKS